MSKYDSLLADLAKPRNVTPSEAVAAAAQAVQTSLFQRLRRAHGGPLAGRLSWMLVRAAQPDRDECSDAHAALLALDAGQLRAFLVAARGAQESLRDPAAARFAGDVVEALGTVMALKVGKEGEAQG